MQILQTRIKTEFLHTSDGKEIFSILASDYVRWLHDSNRWERFRTVNKYLIDKNFFEKIYSLLD